MPMDKLVNYHEPQLKGCVNNENVTSVCWFIFLPVRREHFSPSMWKESPGEMHLWPLSVPLCVQTRGGRVVRALEEFGRNHWPQKLPLTTGDKSSFLSTPPQCLRKQSPSQGSQPEMIPDCEGVGTAAQLWTPTLGSPCGLSTIL